MSSRRSQPWAMVIHAQFHDFFPRKLIEQLISWFRRYICQFWRRAGLLIASCLAQLSPSFKFPSVNSNSNTTLTIISSDFLHFSVSVCRLAFWNHHSSSQRNSSWPDYKEEGPGRNFGEIPCLESKVILIAFCLSSKFLTCVLVMMLLWCISGLR